MQAYICRQDLTTPNNIGLKKLKMPQASLSVTPYSSAATINPLTPTTPGSSTSPLKPGSMPSITRETLALRLRQNWLAKHPIDPPLPTSTSSMDDSLTSLNWLQNLNIMKMATNPTPPASPQPADTATTPQYTPSMQVNPNAILNMGCSSNSVHVKQEPGLVQPPRVNPYMDMVSPSSSPGLDKVDYKTNPCVKPPFSYATLICMAMKETKKNKITLAGIYNWITENFMYYKVAEPSWQNSIRHNLSLNKCFQKVARRKDEPGKGGFWRINPEYEDNFINGIFKKRRGSTSIPIPIQSTGVKRRREMVEPDSDSGDSNSYNGTYSYRPSKMAHVDIKKEPVEAIDTFEDGMEFNWSSILGQDIEVGGVKVKTEDIIDGDVASPITAMSPPPSEGSTSNQDDIVLDDFFNTELGDALASDEPLDFTTGGPLDLSISGMSLKAPQWWDEGLVGGSNENDDGLHTPVAQSPAYTHPWAEDKQELDNAIACFDTDFANLIDIENMPSPQLANLHADS